MFSRSSGSSGVERQFGDCQFILRCCRHRHLVERTYKNNNNNSNNTSLHSNVSLSRCDLFNVNFMSAAKGAAHAGAARRRRHRAYLKYVRMSVALALSEYKHHTSRGHMVDRAGVGYEKHNTLHGYVPEQPPTPSSPPPPLPPPPDLDAPVPQMGEQLVHFFSGFLIRSYPSSRLSTTSSSRAWSTEICVFRRLRKSC